MGTIHQGITGGFSGKVGTVIGSSWNGVDYMRGIPTHMANPQTAGQQNQRAKVALMMKFLSPLKDFLRVGFKKQAVKMSPFNAAMSYNLAHAVVGNSPDFAIDYSKVMVSRGKLPAAVSPEVTSPAKGQVEFRWQDNSSDKGAMPNDRALLLVYNPEKGQVITWLEGNMRTSGSQLITLPTEIEGVALHCYIAFRNASQTMISDSGYAGEVLV